MFIFSPENDWRAQHRKFHKQFKKTHPSKESAYQNGIYFFTWPKNNIFCGANKEEKPIATGLDGKKLQICVVTPYVHSYHEHKDDLHDSMSMVD